MVSRAVHRQLHVACTGSFLARCGDLLAEVGSRINVLCVFDVVIRQKNNLESIPQGRVAIQHVRDRIDQLDDQLGHK